MSYRGDHSSPPSRIGTNSADVEVVSDGTKLMYNLTGSDLPMLRRGGKKRVSLPDSDVVWFL